MKKSFTLLEVIFVLIILGILASLGSEVIAKIYENYLLSRSVSTTSYKLDVAMMQIAKRYSQRVKGTAIAKAGSVTISLMTQVANGANFNHIEWFGRAFEARRGEWNGTYYQPGWSGLADLNTSTKSVLVTPGSNLSAASHIIEAVYGYDLNSTNTAQNGCAVVFFNTYSGSLLSALGWDGSTPNAVYTVYRVSDTKLGFLDTSIKKASDIYDLTCSAYAIDHNVSAKTLTLYYNYRPWLGENYTNGKKVLLLDNVTTFQMRKLNIKVANDPGALEIRICSEDNTTGTPVEFCGKKVIF